MFCFSTKSYTFWHTAHTFFCLRPLNESIFRANLRRWCTKGPARPPVGWLGCIWNPEVYLWLADGRLKVEAAASLWAFKKRGAGLSCLTAQYPRYEAWKCLECLLWAPIGRGVLPCCHMKDCDALYPRRAKSVFRFLSFSLHIFIYFV